MTEHGDHTYVEAVEEPAFRAECQLCGWKGPLRDRTQYSLAVEDQMAHSEGGDQ